MSEGHYFSRASLDLAGLDRGELYRITRGDAYVDHALVWRLFPGNGEGRDFVFRAERNASGWPEFYVVSRRKPQAAPGLMELQTKPFAPILRAGERLQFRLRANPTEATAEAVGTAELARYNATRAASGMPERPQRLRRRFHDVLMAAKRRHPVPNDAAPEAGQQREEAIDAAARGWLVAQAARLGLRLDDGESVFEWSGYTQHRLLHHGRRIEFSSVDYEGIAEVADPDKLLAALTAGVGRAKAFGCGLLLVRRAT